MKYIYLILILITGLSISCTKEDTGDVSTVTNYPVITMNGENPMFVDLGATFTDPGAVATEGGSEIDVTTTIGTGTYFGAAGVDTSSPDVYSITYSAENVDGFSGSVTRSVIVAETGDLITNISGLYRASSQRAPDFEFLAKYTDMEYVFITKTGDATYEISHAIGGYYDFGRGYGPGYAARGAIITANDIPSNDFTITQAVFPLWGNVVDITDFAVDATTNSITFTGNGDFGNGTFHVQLTQVEL